LPVISSNGQPPRPMGGAMPAQPAQSQAPAQNQAPAQEMAAAPVFSGIPGKSGVRDSDIFSSIERLADLKAKGILSDDEFAAKKAELLSRL
jgi:hypothetical protein